MQSLYIYKKKEKSLIHPYIYDGELRERKREKERKEYYLSESPLIETRQKIVVSNYRYLFATFDLALSLHYSFA